MVPSGVGVFSWWCHLLLTAPILKGLMRDVANKSCFALHLSEKCCLRCVVDGGGGLRSCFLGSHRRNGLSEHERWAPNVGTHSHMAEWVEAMGNRSTLMLSNTTD
jgi:hypothetical protein